MKAIRNKNKLCDILTQESPEWQYYIFEKTGVVADFSKDKQELYSVCCGRIDLDSEAEYHYSCDNDLTEYIEIHSIQELIDYICEMDAYVDLLQDYNYGRFTKADLFWNVFSQVIHAKENLPSYDKDHELDWHLYSIETYEKYIEFHMALIACDQYDSLIDWSRRLSLETALQRLVKDINDATEPQRESYPKYRVWKEHRTNPPHTLAELISRMQLLDEFRFPR